MHDSGHFSPVVECVYLCKRGMNDLIKISSLLDAGPVDRERDSRSSFPTNGLHDLSVGSEELLAKEPSNSWTAYLNLDSYLNLKMESVMHRQLQLPSPSLFHGMCPMMWISLPLVISTSQKPTAGRFLWPIRGPPHCWTDERKKRTI
ncbi:hypothetical protein JTE90_026003 [Oedothorax gibbosus]|uniref:Uncharacterized protein n=1 Tax=Oedothorax gibbosus TaxID=931172 RepID=A0AAV6UHN7_9ARAC|nr:hypothetical protein JTE90_026003 [Oedothorax gibbosus]